MRITLVTIGSRGDIQPFIPLAVGLKNAGHAVRVATHEPYESFVREHGLDFGPLVGNPQEMMQAENGLEWLETGRNPFSFAQRMRDLAIEMMQQLGRDTLAACHDADVILFSTLGFFTAVPTAEKLGVPAIATYLQPVQQTGDFPGILFPSLPGALPFNAAYNRLTYDAMMELMWRVFKQAYNDVRVNLLSLPPETRSFRITMNDPYPVIYGFSPQVIPHPRDWRDDICISGYWFLEVPDWQPSDELRHFLESGPAPVYVGFGSMTNRDTDALTDTIIDGICQSNQRAILLSGWAGIGERDLPESIFRLDYAPHSWLFPRMAAVVHHGGAGTTAAGLRAGIPSVIVPHFADQPFWASRVAALGVGPAPIQQKQLIAEKLAYAIHVAATNTAMRQRAAQLGERIRAEDGVQTAVQYIEQTLSAQK
ncbi:MAG: glycosyl transferase [Anaerolineaceae bacterium]|nr:glycosyl transferase [Anaerolineaceae bacterium]